LLKKVVDTHGPKNWKFVAKHLENRSHIQFLQRWARVFKKDVKRGKWSAEEDEQLIELVKNAQFLQDADVLDNPPNKCSNWGDIAKLLGTGRSAKQCRERWFFNLDSRIRRDPWSSKEDQLLLSLQRKLGNRWSTISKSFNGRTENNIKSRFRTLERREAKKWRPVEDALVLNARDEERLSFKEIAEKLPNRRANAVRVRYKQLKQEEYHYGKRVPPTHGQRRR